LGVKFWEFGRLGSQISGLCYGNKLDKSQVPLRATSFNPFLIFEIANRTTWLTVHHPTITSSNTTPPRTPTTRLAAPLSSPALKAPQKAPAKSLLTRHINQHRLLACKSSVSIPLSKSAIATHTLLKGDLSRIAEGTDTGGGADC